VAFPSAAPNLVPGDTNGAFDIFVRDRVLGTNERVSISSDAAQGNGTSDTPYISYNGRYVAFSSGASNLVTGDTNGVLDVFVRDRDTDADGIFDEPGAASTARMSVRDNGGQASFRSAYPVISANGRWVAFNSDYNFDFTDSNGADSDVYLHDRLGGDTMRASVAFDGTGSD